MYTNTWKLTLNTATTMQNEFEEEMKDHLAFLLWNDVMMTEFLQEEINNEENEKNSCNCSQFV